MTRTGKQTSWWRLASRTEGGLLRHSRYLGISLWRIPPLCYLAVSDCNQPYALGGLAQVLYSKLNNLRTVMGVQIEKYTKVVIERQPDYYLVNCGYCNGSGQKYPQGSSSKKCPTCSGKGVRKVESKGKNNESLLKCGYCGGAGQKYPSGSSSKKCPICNGIGVLVAEFPRIECNYCEGSGQKYPSGSSSKKCPTCYGYGSNPMSSVK